MTVAQVFWNGDSQAIRLPVSLNLPTKKVNIQKVGQRLIVEPILEEDSNEWDWLDDVVKIGKPDPSFAQAVEELRSVPVQLS